MSNPLRLIEWFIAIATAFGIVWGAFWFMDYRHAKKHALLDLELEIKSEELDREITQKNEARVYYQRLRDEGTLDKAGESRLTYLEGKLERMYDRQADLTSQQDALDKESE